jgi:Spy/CpxP family protein refolding chaperone
MCRWGCALAVVAGLFTSAAAFGQAPPGAPAAGQTPPSGGARPGGPPSDKLTLDQVQQLLDAFVMGRSQNALDLNDAQVSAFFQRMLKLQSIQRRHRNQRGVALNDLRLLVAPNAPPADDAAIAAKTKALDDLEAQWSQDERKALADIDEVLTPRQRARFRIFLENMERQKLDFLVKARGGGAPAPAPAPAAGGATKKH